MKYLQTFLSGALATLACGATAANIDVSKLPPPATKADVNFDTDIEPIFKASCVRCHGAEKPKGGIRLDSRDGVLKGGKDGKIVEVGKSEASQLVIAVSQLDPKSTMPPKPRKPRPPQGGAQGTNAPAGAQTQLKPMGPPPKPLTPEQVGLVRAWIDQGAK